MICAIHPKGRGPGSKGCYTCVVIKDRNREKVLDQQRGEVGMRPVYTSRSSYGLPNIDWPAPKLPTVPTLTSSLDWPV